MTKLYLAPMAEISHRALRELAESFGGADEYFSEMLSAGAVTQRGPFERFYLDGGPCPEKLVYQICGAKTEPLARAAAFLDTTECAGIDINMGCSAPSIIKTGAGGAWLSKPDEAARMVRAVRAATSRRLSVKLRTGETDDFDRLARFCIMLQNEGVELITLHPRTTTGKFNTEAKTGYAAALQNELAIPVAANGFMPSIESARAYAQSGVYKAIMLGRLAVTQPWCFAAIRGGPDATGIIDYQALALRFLELLAQYQPPEFHVSRARRFFGYYCKNFVWGEYLKNTLFRETTLDGMGQIIRREAALFAARQSIGNN